MSGAAKGGRDLVAQYAGHLANLLNGNDHLRPMRLRRRARLPAVRAGLARAHDNRRYWRVSSDCGPITAAGIRRGRRCLFRPGAGSADRASARQPSSADNLRDYLVAAAASPFHADAAGELSTWKAMVDGPQRIRRPARTNGPVRAVESLLKCLDAANRPMPKCCATRPVPKDWLTGSEEVTVNTLKSANGFLKALRVAMNDEVGRRTSTEELENGLRAIPRARQRHRRRFRPHHPWRRHPERVAGQDVTRFVSFEQVETVLSETFRTRTTTPCSPPTRRCRCSTGPWHAVPSRPTSGPLLAAILEGRPLAEAMRSDISACDDASRPTSTAIWVPMSRTCPPAWPPSCRPRPGGRP